MTDIAFYVPGVPVPKARKVTTRTGHTYMPKATVAYESLVRQTFAAKYPGMEPETGPVHLYVTFCFPIPKSAKRKKVPDKINPGDPFAIRPDLDNLVKSVLDGLNSVALADDRQVVGIFAAKKYGKVPGVMVSLKPAIGGNQDD